MTSATLKQRCLWIAVFAAIPLLFGMPALQAEILNGRGTAGFEMRNLPHFSNIVVEDSIQVYLQSEESIGSRQQLSGVCAKVEAEQNLLPSISTSVEGETLHIFFNKSIRPTKQITVSLPIKNLAEITTAGTAILASKTPLELDKLAINASGASQITLSKLICNTLTISIEGSSTVELQGEAGDQLVSIRGAAVYRSSEFAAERATLSISGAGKAWVNVKDKLAITLTGAAYLGYKGDPEVVQSIGGLGRLERLSRPQ